jgi:hypothetical protein
MSEQSALADHLASTQPVDGASRMFDGPANFGVGQIGPAQKGVSHVGVIHPQSQLWIAPAARGLQGARAARGDARAQGEARCAAARARARGSGAIGVPPTLSR